jgi:carbon-monoxide dehydrogenase medium subunit
LVNSIIRGNPEIRRTDWPAATPRVAPRGGSAVKAPPFDYVRPASLEEAIAALREFGDRARLIAGGQTLLATLNMRLSEPQLLIDLAALQPLRGITAVARPEGTVLRIGALTTHSEIERDALVARHTPLLRMAAPHIAHRAIRNRGTWGGSIAYADPAAEWPACLVALDGTVVVRGPAGERRIAAAEFFVDLYTTALGPAEIVIACELPVCGPTHRFAFDELARRHGDYAIVGMALAATLESARLARLRLVFLGVGTTPVRAPRTEAVLQGRALDGAVIEAAVHALTEDLDPMPDPTHTAATKRHLAGVLTRRALAGLTAPQAGAPTATGDGA